MRTRRTNLSRSYTCRISGTERVLPPARSSVRGRADFVRAFVIVGVLRLEVCWNPRTDREVHVPIRQQGRAAKARDMNIGLSPELVAEVLKSKREGKLSSKLARVFDQMRASSAADT